MQYVSVSLNTQNPAAYGCVLFQNSPSSEKGVGFNADEN